MLFQCTPLPRLVKAFMPAGGASHAIEWSTAKFRASVRSKRPLGAIREHCRCQRGVGGYRRLVSTAMAMGGPWCGDGIFTCDGDAAKASLTSRKKNAAGEPSRQDGREGCCLQPAWLERLRRCPSSRARCAPAAASAGWDRDPEPEGRGAASARRRDATSAVEIRTLHFAFTLLISDLWRIRAALRRAAALLRAARNRLLA